MRTEHAVAAEKDVTNSSPYEHVKRPANMLQHRKRRYMMAQEHQQRLRHATQQIKGQGGEGDK